MKQMVIITEVISYDKISVRGYLNLNNWTGLRFTQYVLTEIVSQVNQH